MSSQHDDSADYVMKVRRETQEYIEDLLGENARVREALAALVQEKQALQARVAALENRDRGSEPCPTEGPACQRDRERFAEIEQQNANLANLYVASYRLHATLDRDEVVAVILDIIINLVGSEQVAVFELTEDRARLSLLTSCGVDAAKLDGMAIEASGDIRSTIEGGEPIIFEHGNAPDQPRPLSACVPLKLGDRAIGVIAIYELLPQKPRLEPVDRELFELLATHAATALYCTRLHGQARKTA